MSARGGGGQNCGEINADADIAEFGETFAGVYQAFQVGIFLALCVVVMSQTGIFFFFFFALQNSNKKSKSVTFP